MIEDLLTPDAGFAISEREVEESEVGGSPRHLADIVLGVVRDGELHRVDASAVDALERGRPAALRAQGGPAVVPQSWFTVRSRAWA